MSEAQGAALTLEIESNGGNGPHNPHHDLCCPRAGEVWLLLCPELSQPSQVTGPRLCWEGERDKDRGRGLLVFAIILAGLLGVRGTDHVSFLTGLLVGMTLIQTYFHQFS